MGRKDLRSRLHSCTYDIHDSDNDTSGHLAWCLFQTRHASTLNRPDRAIPSRSIQTIAGSFEQVAL